MVLAVVLACAMLLGFIPLASAGALSIASALLMVSREHRHSLSWRVVLMIPALMLLLFAAIYRPKGFFYPELLSFFRQDQLIIVRWNLSKTIGAAVIIYLFWDLIEQSFRKTKLKNILMWSALGCAFAFTIGLALFGEAQAELTSSVMAFIFVNVLISVLPEEIFFRTLIQQRLERRFTSKPARAVILLLMGALFAISHSAFTLGSFVLFFLAGFLYALAFRQTQSVFCAIACHWAVNVTHVTCFPHF